MDEFTDPEALAPLLDFVRTERNPDLRLAALAVAGRFRLDAAGWHEVAAATMALVDELAPGSPARGSALDLMASIPLGSVRNELRRRAQDPRGPDADHIDAALERVHDPSRARPLLARLRAGHDEVLALLAAMPLEDVGISPAEFPPADGDLESTLRLWRALALARVGDYAALDAFLSGEVATPPLFWGDPWSAYSALAAIAPIPDAMRIRLLEALPAVRRIDDAERCRMAELIVWAVTGSADAHGRPTEPAAPRAADRPDSTPAETGAARGDEAAAHASDAAQQVVERLSESESGAIAPSADELEALRDLPAESANELALSLFDAASRRAVRGGAHTSARQSLGNALIGIVSMLRANPTWPVAELTARFLAQPHSPLDVAQMAFVLARGPLGRAIGVLVPELAAGIAHRDRALELLVAVADVQAGRAASPWRGAGGGAAGGAIPALIDDDAQAAAPPAAAPPAAAPAPPPAQEAGRGEATPSGASSRRTIPGEAPAAEKRRVHARLLQDGRERQTFVASAEHVIRCWIGLPEKGAAGSDRSVPEVDIPAEGLPLTVQLLWDGQQAGGSLLLPADRTARSNDCDLRIRVPEGERFVSAEIAFLYRGRVFELVRVEAFVLGPDEAEKSEHTLSVRTRIQRREVIELPDRAAYRAMFVWGDDAADRGRTAAGDRGGRAEAPGRLLEFGTSGAARYSLANAKRAVQWLNEAIFNTDKSLVRRRAGSGAAGEAVLDDDDDLVLDLLRQLARHGTELYNQLRAQRLSDPGERIQLLNQSPDEYVPLEFVYDAGYPTDEARLCRGWSAALAGDAPHCPVCKPPADLSDDERDSRAVICPLGFWSLQKIIERIDPQREAGAAASSPRASRRALGPLDRIVFAVSHNVEAGDREAVGRAIGEYVGDAVLADDWQAWRTALERARTPLLLALPHHGIASFEDYLEVGGEPTPAARRRLARGRLSDLYVNPRHHEPGPIVVLLGCETGAVTETGYVSLARRFQQLESSIVIGTLAKVLGRHAAPVAQELVAQLAAVQDAGSDFGVIMRRVRRRILAKGYLLALCLVALGDADWRLGPATSRAGSGG